MGVGSAGGEFGVLIRRTCAGRRIWWRAGPPTPPRSSRRSSTGLASLASIPSARWRACNQARRSPCRGDTAKAKAAYQDFLTLWKDAERDIPILRQAQAEFGKLP